MEKIRIGTCVPGQGTEQLLPHFIQAGFECVGVNFHMVFTEKDLPTYAEKVKRLLDGSDMKVSSIGYYCNALQNEEQRKTLEQFIDNAHLFGTNLVTTFAGALEGEPVEKAIPRFKEVFGELAKRAGVEMPITQAAYQVLYEGRDPKTVLQELMRREKRHEMEETWI